MYKRFKEKTALVTVIVAIVLSVSSCYVTQEATDTKDLSYIYNPTKNIFTPYYSIFNENDQTSILSIRIRRGELYFNEANASGLPMASLLVSVRLFDNNVGGSLSDTAQIRYDILRDEVQGEFVGRIPLKAYEGSSYTAEIKIIDLIRQRTIQSFVNFERNGPNSRYNFKIVDHFSKNEVYTNILRRDQYVNILYPLKNIDTLWLSYFRVVAGVPPAPSEILPEVTPANNPEIIIPLAYSDTLPVMFPREGIYMLSLDSALFEGLTICNFGTDHPSMDDPSTMIPPLGYIATPEEMAVMTTSEKPKLALDNFWFERTGSIERSKELIRIYYNRTLFANYYFSSYKAGWLTDRGMIYIIYGPPDKLYKNNEGESWGYRKAPEKSRWGARYSVEDKYLWFNFKRQKSIFSDNDYTLNRASTPVSYWDVAVARWREGRVFRLDNPEELK